MIKNNKSKNNIQRQKNFAILIRALITLLNAKKPMFISRLSKNCHSRYDTIRKIIDSYPKIFKITEISPNRKLVALNRDPIIFEKISQIVNNLRYLEQFEKSKDLLKNSFDN